MISCAFPMTGFGQSPFYSVDTYMHAHDLSLHVPSIAAGIQTLSRIESKFDPGSFHGRTSRADPSAALTWLQSHTGDI